MLDVLDSEPESPFRLSRPSEVSELEDSFGFPVSREAQSPFKLSRLCELPESEPVCTLSTLYECTPNIAALDPADGELLTSVPAAIAEQYIARLSHVERLRQDAEQQSAELEASLSAMRRRDARQCCRGLCGIFLALMLGLMMLLFVKRVSPECSGGISEDPPLPEPDTIHVACEPNACSAQLKAVEDDVSAADHRRERDTQGYMQALSGVDAWVTGSWEEGLFRNKVPTGGLARCVNETQVTYRNLVSDLNSTLMRRHDAEVRLREQVWHLRRAQFGLGPRVSTNNLKN